MGSAIEIRQMMAEGKFPIAQFEIEASLKSAQGQERREFLFLLLELLKLDQRGMPTALMLEASKVAFHESRELFHQTLPHLLNRKTLKDLLDFRFLLISDLEEKGKLAELLNAISDYQIFCVENKIPFLDPRIQELSRKYFRHEFSLCLQRITLGLMQGNSKLVIQEIRETILGLHEFRGRNQKSKLGALVELLGSFELTGELILYRNFITIKSRGIQEKRDFKSLLEWVIGVEDYKLLIHALDLVHSHLSDKAIETFVIHLRSLPDFNFLFLEKNFTHLKKFFVNVDEESETRLPKGVIVTEEDLALETSLSVDVEHDEVPPSMEEEEVNLLKQIQYGDFNFSSLCDLTIGFLQSDYLRAAKSSSLRAVGLANSPEEKIRATYLRITVLMKLADYRSALDAGLSAMDLVTTQDDLLSLLYVQAECHEKIGARSEAKKILQRILEIDEEYRLAKERLERINEA